jgi:hypothetical protein
MSETTDNSQAGGRCAPALGSDSEKLLKLIAAWRKAQDVFDAALTVPGDAGYRADAWDALAEMERITNEADSPNAAGERLPAKNA